MIAPDQFKILLPLACEWAQEQEKRILSSGVELDTDQQIDAFLIGIKAPEKVRLLEVDNIPTPSHPALKAAAKLSGLLSAATAGVTFRYGIYIRSDCRNQRRLVVHELVHTMQYERMGGIRPFLEQYLQECLTFGYPYGPLEQEARTIEMKFCD